MLRCIRAGVTNSQKPLLEIDSAAIEDALPWLRPGTPVTSESAGEALEIVVKCSATVGFTPQIFANRLRQMVEGRAV